MSTSFSQYLKREGQKMNIFKRKFDPQSIKNRMPPDLMCLCQILVGISMVCSFLLSFLTIVVFNNILQNEES